MINNINKTFLKGTFATVGLAAMFSCSDTWNDHYTAEAIRANDGTTMAVIEKEASDFAAVVKAVGFDRELNSDNSLTVFAPVNGSFNVSDYVNSDGSLAMDSSKIVDTFIKHHVVRASKSLNSTECSLKMLSSKKVFIAKDNTIDGIAVSEANVSCSNGLVHFVESPLPYMNNIFEQIVAEYEKSTNENKETCSLYSFLKVYDTDSLDEFKSVNRGFDEQGNKIWVDSVTIRNNTMLNNCDALVYDEDSSYIAIIPSTEAWQARYEEAKALLKYNNSENTTAFPNMTDSLQRRYANLFCMTDLFYNKNANRHMEDSLISSIYNPRKWYEHVYYVKEPKNMPRGKQVNDILSKCGDPIECSNGTVYNVDEYPFTKYEQFFKEINLSYSSLYRALDLTKKPNGDEWFCKYLDENSIDGNMRTYTSTYYKTINEVYDADSNLVDFDTEYLGQVSTNYSYVDMVPAAEGSLPSVAIRIPDNLSGSYDVSLVTVPEWIADFEEGKSASDRSNKKYKFNVKIFEKGNDGTFPDNASRPSGFKSNYETTETRDAFGGVLPIDTTFIGTVEFKNCYYNTTEGGVNIQITVNYKTKEKDKFSNRLRINSLILTPHDDSSKAKIRLQAPVATPKKEKTNFIVKEKLD